MKMASLLKFISNGVALHSRSLPNLCSSSNSVVNYSKIARISQKLGIPEPPKKPITGFIRFQMESRSTLKQQSLSQTEVFSAAGAQWRQMSEEQKEKYNKIYKQEMSEYTKLYKKYVDSLTPEQKQAIKSERKDQKEHRTQANEKKLLKNEKESLGKPKKPSSAYLLFALEGSNKKPAESKNDWDRLSDDQKQAYKQKAQQLRDVYEEKLIVWEDKMMKEGKGHLIRKSRFLTKTTDEKKSRKKSNVE